MINLISDIHFLKFVNNQWEFYNLLRIKNLKGSETNESIKTTTSIMAIILCFPDFSIYELTDLIPT